MLDLKIARVRKDNILNHLLHLLNIEEEISEHSLATQLSADQ